MNNKIIVEIIPNHSNSKIGFIVQLQALKIDNLRLIDRFDYRVEEKLVENKDLRNLISYDKENFIYVNKKDIILDKFKEWIQDYKLLIIDNEYTKDYLQDFEYESIFKYLNMEYSNDIIDKIINKYNLEPSNNIVDLLYEALIYESNNK